MKRANTLNSLNGAHERANKLNLLNGTHEKGQHTVTRTTFDFPSIRLFTVQYDSILVVGSCAVCNIVSVMFSKKSCREKMDSLLHILYSKQPPGCDMEWFINGIHPGCQESHLYCRHLLAKILIFNKMCKYMLPILNFPCVTAWLSYGCHLKSMIYQ